MTDFSEGYRMQLGSDERPSGAFDIWPFVAKPSKCRPAADQERKVG